jgi:hypothetical protein
MKKIVLIVASLFVFSAFVFAAKPPAKVQKAFNSKFPEAASVKWAKENSKEWEAEFTVNGVKTSANFKTTGDWVETESQIDISELPEAVTAAIKKLHPKSEITAAYRIESATAGTKYEADVKTGKKITEVILKEDGTSLR